MASPVTIFGYGNPLRRDDGIGWVAANRLKGRFKPRLAEIITTHQLLPEQADILKNTQYAIFIDAKIGQMPGTVMKEKLQPQSRSGQLEPHHMDPQGLLTLCYELFGHAPKAELITISGEDFSYGEGLSKTVEDMLDHLVNLVDSKVQTWSMT